MIGGYDEYRPRRVQFAFTSINHFLFVPITIGLAFLIALLQTAWHRNDRDEYLRLTRFFGTLLVINIAIGVVTGLVQEFEFGMNWGLTHGWSGTSSVPRWRWRAWPRSSWSRCRRRSSWPPTPGCSTRSAT
jgi:Cytochrome bd terminal oxidase subunit I